MSSPKKFKRGWMILVLVIVAALLAPWGWSIYKEARPKEVRIREAIEELVVPVVEEPRPRLLVKWGRFLERSKRSIGIKPEAHGAKLRAFGFEAFPYLIEHLDDNRRAWALGSYANPTVGAACYRIIEGHLFDWAADYPYGWYRRGADGENHPRPGPMDGSIFGDDFKGWLIARKDRSLAELQLEVQAWALSQEKKIGLSEPGDEETFIEPLRRRVSKLRATVDAERKR